MRRILLAACAALGFAPTAHAADCALALGRVQGPAPLSVSYSLRCSGTASALWSFGDGTATEGLSVHHTYVAGRFDQGVDVTTEDGVVTHYDLAPAIAYRLQLAAPHRARYGERVRLQGKLFPALAGAVTVAGRRARFVAPGVFRVVLPALRPGPYVARFRGAVSAAVWILLRPRLDVRVDGSPTVGSSVRVVAALHPAHAGTVRIQIDGRRANVVPTRHARTSRVVVSTLPRKGWTGPHHVERVSVVAPNLAAGSTGASVRELERLLLAQHYAMRGIDGAYGPDDTEAVYAFQKVHGLARTGVVDKTLWQRLARAGVPRPRYGGDHIEVDKTRQVLFVVRGGKVALAVHASTGAAGNTPLGTWHVYSKVPGWSWVLWYPSFFLRGFAIHGYPDVPAYPASHGCVRVPMWVAPTLYADAPFGSTIIVYE